VIKVFSFFACFEKASMYRCPSKNYAANKPAGDFIFSSIDRKASAWALALTI
jgi:hypothetical protein